ncbi:PAS domain S-box protein [uncultured Nevskia sp.]|uniref:PAS domain S-box protein n=1 Tax=uncultured Nevskia sp. TaxID=228950 RepID=UPI0025FD3C56|nr:PAS domain S-box protein [uncultured Nevskia sp.]
MSAAIKSAERTAAGRLLSAGRDRILVMTAILVGLLLLTSALALPAPPQVMAWEPLAFTASGVLMLLTALLFSRRRLSYGLAAALTLGITIGMLLLRVAMVFIDDTFADSTHSLFMPAYAYYTVVYLMLAILLPNPASMRCSVAAWLALASLVTFGSLSLFDAEPPRPFLMATLIYVWLGHGLFVALLTGWTRQQRALVDAHARLAEIERAGRLSALVNEQRFRIVFEQSTAGVGLIGADGCWQIASGRMAELTGYSLQQLEGMSLLQLLVPGAREAARQRLDNFINGEQPRYSVERQWLRRDGDLIWVSLHFEQVPGSAELPSAAVVMAIDIGAGKKAEQETQELQRIRDFHIDNMPLAMIEWDRDLRVCRWSKQAEDMLGWPAEAVVGRTLREVGVLDADEAENHEQVMSEFLSGQRSAVESLRRTRHRDGHLAWYRWHSHSLAGADGRPEFFFTAGFDVTEYLANNLRLDESRRELRAIFEQAAVGIAMLDAHGHMLSVNRRFCDILGRSEAELLSTDFQSITHPEDLALDVAQAGAVAAGVLPGYTMEKRYLGQDGGIIWVRLHVGRIDATAITPMRFVSVIEDIGERKRAEQLALEHQRVREFHFDNTPLAVIEWTPDLRVKRWSVHAMQMFGWSEAEVVGKSPFAWRFFHDDDLDRVTDVAQTIFDSPLPTIQTICRNYHRDGNTVWCQWHSSIQRGANGEVQSVLSMASDVSNQQVMLGELRDSQARFQCIFEQAAVGIAMIDAQGNWLMVNQRFREIVGYGAEELLQHRCEEITDPKDRAAEAMERARLVGGEIDDYNFVKRYRHHNGQPVWVSLYARRLDDGSTGDNVRLSLVVVDITEQRHAEAQIKRLNADLEKRVTERTRQLNDTVHSWVERNQELSLLNKMTGLLAAAIDSVEARSIVRDYLPRLFNGYGGALWLGDGKNPSFSIVAEWGSRQLEMETLSTDDCWALRRGQRLRIDDPAHPHLCPHLDGHADGRDPHTCVPITALGSTVGLMHLAWSERIGSLVKPPDETLLSSVVEQIGLAIGNVRLREELRRQAIRDPLTGLYNRRHFDELLRARMAEHDRSGRGFSVLMIDIDHFKRINDQHGHETGDEVLRETARHLQESVRAGEAAFRFGGEEFVLLIDDGEHPDGSQAMRCAERVRREIAELRVHSRGRVLPPVTVSIGVAGYPRDVELQVSPLQRADDALYTAKRTGRNRVCSAGAVPGLEVAVGLVKL